MGKKRFFVGDEVWFTECGELTTGFIIGFHEGWVDKGVFKFNANRECIIDNGSDELCYWGEEYLNPIETVPLNEVFYDT